jgi:hypothetical protein
MGNTIKIRCYIKKDGDLFIGTCLDLCLSAQGHSAKETFVKLNEQIEDYLKDITEGELKEYARDLYPRRAPFQYWMEYYWLRFKIAVVNLFNHSDSNNNSDQTFKKRFNHAI